MSEPRSTRRPSLRGQLVLLVAALAIPLLLLQGWWSLHDYRGARERAESDALAFADATALGVLQFFSAAEELMTATAREFGSHGPEDQECAEHMRTMNDLLPFLANALAVDRSGLVVCSVLNAPPGSSATEWPWWQPMVANPRFMRGAPVMGDFTGTWILPLVVPVLDENGAFDGAIVGTLELTELSRLFGGVNLPQTHLITVATADRVVIARSHEAEERVGQHLPELTGSDRSVGPGRWVATGPDLAGIPRTWGQVEIPGGWIVYVGVPDEIVYGPALRESLAHVATTLLVLLLGVLLAALSYRRIRDALRELAVHTGAIKAGASVPLPAGAPKEVAEVVDQFNHALRERDVAEAAERRAHQRVQSIFDNAVFGLCLTTPDGRFLQANPALVRMLGYESEQALMDAGTLALYPSRERREEVLREVVAKGRHGTHEVEWLRADGTPIIVRISGAAAEGPEGEQAYETIVLDITDEKRTENELRQTQKMEAIGQLAGGVAHDFNNLLTVIGGNAELLEEHLTAEDPLRADLSQIAKATQRATSLTRRLLAFSRGGPRVTQVLDVNAMVPELGKMLVPLIGEDVELEVRLGEGTLTVALDPGEMEQTLLNLVLNARDAMPDGGRLVIATARGRKHRGDPAERPTGAEGVVLSVSDTGSGMDPGTEPRIFEPFFTTKPMGQGTGLGLSTVYGIVKRAGGSIAVETKPGAGTTMRLWFPLADAEDESPAAPSGTELSGSETVLVVEDDDLVRAFVQRALAEAGYEVLSTGTGAEALDALEARDGDVDLVLTDVVMPGMSGPELAQRLSIEGVEAPVLFMSGYIDRAFLSGEMERHPESLLRKPFTAVELRRRVREVLDRTTVTRGS